MDIVEKMDTIIELIESWEDDDIKTYKVSPLLKELISLNQLYYNKEHEKGQPDKEVMTDYYNYYIFIADTYKRMGRFSLAALYHEKALDIAIEMSEKNNIKPHDLDSLLSDTIRERNFYVDDDCEDLLDKIRKHNLLKPEVIEKIKNRVFSRRRSLKHDPVEMSEAYLAVIDEVEEKIDKNRTLWGMGSCHEVWDLKTQYLAEKGISWRSPAMLNPRVMFD